MNMDESLFIERVRQGDAAAYEHLVKKYQARLVTFLGNQLGSIDDARDVAQEVFIQAFVKIKEFAPGRSFKAWLFAIAYNRSIDLLRKKRSFRRFWEQATTAAAARPAGPGRSLDGPLFWQPALRRMTPQERSVLALKYNEDCSSGEIAAALGCSESTVRVHLLNARKKLKKELLAAGFAAANKGSKAEEVP
jgi:RNA polymerase sigma-70 factor (ECF subfamily)